MSAQITVVVATYRPLGAVLPLRGLALQSFRDFEVVVVTEVGERAWSEDGRLGDKAWLNETEGRRFPLNAAIIPLIAPAAQYHSPPHALNRGLIAAETPLVALLADFAYPDERWLERMVTTLQTSGAALVGGTKCPHGVAADVFTATPPAWSTQGGPEHVACAGHPLLPVGIQSAPEPCVIYACQGGFNLGNVIFHRADALAVNGIEERFSGGHGYEDENFVRRMTAHKKVQAVIDKRAVIHHYWPYSSGYKPLLLAAARPWANGHTNAELDRFLTDGETVVGNHWAQRVPLVQVPPEALVPRVAAAPPEVE